MMLQNALPRVIGVAWIVLISAGLFQAAGQQASLAVGSASVNAGGTAIVNLSLSDLSGAAPAALQFTLSYPPSAVTGVTLSAGAAASASNKQLDCFPESSGKTSCLIYGGNSSALESGVVASIAVHVAPNPGTSAVPLQLNGVLATDANAEQLAGAATSGSISVNSSAPTLSSISCSPSSLTSSGQVSCQVTLSGLTSSALSVPLATSNSDVVIPTTVNVAAGVSAAQFQAFAKPFTVAQSVLLSATANGTTKTTSLQLQPVLTETVSGTLGSTAGAGGALVTLRTSSGQVVKSVTSQPNGSYILSGLTNGTDVVTPSKAGVIFQPASKTITVRPGNTTGVNFTNQVTGSAGGSIRLDARVSNDQQSPAARITTSPFSTSAANELLLAFVATDQADSSDMVVRSVTGAGLQWTLVARTNTQLGTSEIWRAFATAPLSKVAATATLSQNVVSTISVITLAGVQTTGTGGSGAIGAIGHGFSSSGAPNATLKTTKNGSIVIGVGNDYDNALLRTPNSGQQIIHQDLSSTADTYWVQVLNGTVPFAGTSVTLGDTAPASDQYNMAICEVLPAGGN